MERLRNPEEHSFVPVPCRCDYLTRARGARYDHRRVCRHSCCRSTSYTHRE